MTSLLRALTAIASLALFFGALFAFYVLFLGYGLPPCAEPGQLHEFARILVPASLAVGAIWTGLLVSRANVRSLLGALALPAFALAFYAIMAAGDAQAQQQCKAETLEQAAARCRIDLSVYRRGRDEYGNPIYALVAPGETDQAWDCLNRWAMHNRSISMTVDPSVVQHREQAGKQAKP